MKPVVLIGAGRAARFTRDICRCTGQEIAGVAVDGHGSLSDLPTICSYQDILSGKAPSRYGYLIAVGDPDERGRLYEALVVCGAEVMSAVHPSAFVSADAKVGSGVIINAFSSVLADALIGQGCLIEDHCAVGVGVRVGAFCTIAPGSYLNAECQIGERCFIGSGTTMKPEQQIGDHCVVGAGAAVVSDLPSYTIAAGVPAKRLRSPRHQQP